MEHLYIVAYDITDPKRWRKVYRLMLGYGEWLQLSVFQCRLSRTSLVELEARLSELIKHEADHVLILDVGPLGDVKPQVRSLGKAFEPVRREAVIV